MNVYLQKLTQATMSYFDVSQNEPEKFFHGFVLGLLTSLQNRFVLTSNRESGLGRYTISCLNRLTDSGIWLISLNLKPCSTLRS